MKQPMSVGQVLAYKTDEPIDAVRGVLRFVGKHRLIVPEAGREFTVQSFTLGDDADRVDGEIFDHLDIAEFLNRDIVLASQKSRNGRYGGVTVQREFKRVAFFKDAHHKIKLKVTKAGVVHTPETYAFSQPK